MRLLQNVTIPVILEKDDGLFCSDWREDVVFSWLRCGGNRSPEPFDLAHGPEPFDRLRPRTTSRGKIEGPGEGNAEGVRIPC